MEPAIFRVCFDEPDEIGVNGGFLSIKGRRSVNTPQCLPDNVVAYKVEKHKTK